MSEKRNSFSKTAQSGNAMVYVLIIIGLFAALSYTLSRQTDTGEAGALSEEQAAIYASNLISQSMQVRQRIDQMTRGGIAIDDLDFMKPDDADFDEPRVHLKVFHPHGGGVVLPRLQEGVRAQINTNPPPGWYLGRFNNVAWTPGNGDDVILVAHQLSESICARINERITGNADIPVMTDPARILLIDHEESTAPSNDDLTEVTCEDCEGYPFLCVRDSEGAYSLYNLVGIQ